MVEVVENVATTGDELLVFCDFKYENGIAVPDIGDASDDFPFRIGLTSYSLMKAYVEVQEDPRCTTLLHVDSTHNMVFQRYSVFILGISDSCGHFFPIVYYCASQRRAEDVAWCIAYLKRVMLSTFAVGFTPRFVMTDADDAQYNACSSEVPTSKILMCWFHVCQNAWQKARKLTKIQRDLIFRDLNDLHFCVGETEFETKKAVILKQWKATSSSDRRFRSVGRAISKQWLLHPRFSRWQAYHTPSGYATTNSPVEQYHRTVKLVNSSSDATPIEMVTFLNQSRVGFIAEKTAFSSITKVSKRLKAHYNKIKKQGELKAIISPAVGDLRLQLVRVCHAPRLRTPVAPTHTDHAEGCTRRRGTQTSANSGKKKKKKTGHHADDVGKPIKSAHTLRMQWDGMPVGGWIFDPTTRSCQFRFHIKYCMCPHVIEATKVVGMPCPGLPDPLHRFQSRDKRAKRKHAVSRGCVESAQLADEICDCRSASQGAVGASQGAPTQHPSIAALSADTSSSDSVYPPRTLQHLQQYDALPPTNNPAIPLHVYCPAVPLLDIVADASADRRAMAQRRTVAEAEDRSPVLHFPEAYCVSYPSVSTSLNSLPATARESCDQTKRRRR